MARATKKAVEAKSTKLTTPRISSKKPKTSSDEAPAGPSAAQQLAAQQATVEAAVAKIWGTLRVQSTPISGVDIRAVALAGAKPQWQFVTKGLLTRGAGAEVSFRIVRPKDELVMPAWLHTMWRALIEGTDNEPLVEGQVVRFTDKFGAGLPEIDSDMQAIALGIDPVFGTSSILVAVALTRDEERLVREWSPRGLLEVFSRFDSTLVTDLERASALVSPRTRVIIEQRVDAEGSSLGVMLARVSTLSGDLAAGVTWSLSADAVDTVMALLKGRIGHLRPFSVKGDEGTVEVIPSDFPSVELAGDTLTLKLSQTSARQVRSTLKAKVGTYRWEALPKFTLAVVA